MTPQRRSLSVAVWHRSIAFAKSMAFVDLEASPVSQFAAATLSTWPSQSSSSVFPGDSNAPGFTSVGDAHSDGESQQSPSQVEKPSPSASMSSSGVPLQLSSRPLPQISPPAVTSPWQAPQ